MRNLDELRRDALKALRWAEITRDNDLYFESESDYLPVETLQKYSYINEFGYQWWNTESFYEYARNNKFATVGDFIRDFEWDSLDELNDEMYSARIETQVQCITDLFECIKEIESEYGFDGYTKKIYGKYYNEDTGELYNDDVYANWLSDSIVDQNALYEILHD